MRMAAELAVNEINRTGGVDGRDLQLLVVDDSADTQVAVRVAQQLYDDPRVVAVVGHLTSGTTIAAAPIYNGGESPLLEISPSASSPSVSGAGPFTFRVCPSDRVHGSQLADWARQRLGAERAAVLYQNDSYGRSVRDAFVHSFTGLGGTIVSDDPYILDLPGFRPYLQLMRNRGGAQVLMIAGTRAGAERILPTLDSVGLEVQVMGGDGLVGIEGSEGAEGVFVSTAYLSDQSGETNDVFVSAYRSAHANAVPDHRGAGAYDIVHILAEAIEAVGTDRGRLRDRVAAIGRTLPPYNGVTGRIAFDDAGDVPDKPVVIGVVTANTLVTAPGQ